MAGWGTDEWGLASWGSETQPDAIVTTSTVAATTAIPTPSVNSVANATVTTTTVVATTAIPTPSVNGIGQGTKARHAPLDELVYYGLTNRSRTPGYVRRPRHRV